MLYFVSKCSTDILARIVVCSLAPCVLHQWDRQNLGANKSSAFDLLDFHFCAILGGLLNFLLGYLDNGTELTILLPNYITCISYEVYGVHNCL